jgi:hypothetical protein
MCTEYWWETLLQCEHLKDGGCDTQMNFLLLREHTLKVLNLVKNLKPYMTQMSVYNLKIQMIIYSLVSSIHIN